MDEHMKMSLRVSLFDGEYYALWWIRMKIYMMSIRLEVWIVVEKGYDLPKFTPIEVEDKKKLWEHAKALNTLQAGLSKKVLAKVLNCGNAQQLLD